MVTIKSILHFIPVRTSMLGESFEELIGNLFVKVKENTKNNAVQNVVY